MKTESTDTPGSQVETFNTMVSASGLLQLKTFLASPIKIQILRNAFVACPKTFTKTPKRNFSKVQDEIVPENSNPQTKAEIAFWCWPFPECKYKYTQKGISEELGEKLQIP